MGEQKLRPLAKASSVCLQILRICFSIFRVLLGVVMKGCIRLTFLALVCFLGWLAFPPVPRFFKLTATIPIGIIGSYKLQRNKPSYESRRITTLFQGAYSSL